MTMTQTTATQTPLPAPTKGNSNSAHHHASHGQGHGHDAKKVISDAHASALTRATRLAHLAGRNAAGPASHPHHARFRYNPFAHADQDADLVSHLTLDWVIDTPPTAPALAAKSQDLQTALAQVGITRSAPLILRRLKAVPSASGDLVTKVMRLAAAVAAGEEGVAVKDVINAVQLLPEADEMAMGVVGGMAGVLAALNWLVDAELDSLKADLVKQMIDAGRQDAQRLGIATSRTPLVWVVADDVIDLGAAHGLAGILTVLLSLPRAWIQPYWAELIAAAEYVAEFDGYPVRLVRNKKVADPANEKAWVAEYGVKRGTQDAEVVIEWEQGAAALGLLFVQLFAAVDPEQARQVAQMANDDGESGPEPTTAHDRESWLLRAIEAGNLTWQRGIVNTHVGISTGLCGNAYLFLALWSVTGDVVWYQRALAFAGIAAHWHGGDETHALSVSEGFGGLACLLADLVVVDAYLQHQRASSDETPRPWIGFPCVNDGPIF
ncbi:hypothetical protein BCR44DRAFT_34125 [Catenaria anguillulae PL171]|uniref:Uncharacterized protein n=1 Tax=Catenaria anguillulae PL171 TaxID=765915 RepID=A0A1Y2HUQ0_9FUNG|nr:hypothetical protein BCR44DRAFT_34125 [Catenaria anguillulae PL171]